MESIETTLTHCDGCQTTHNPGCFPLHPAPLPKVCAMLGPDGHYTLALCASCYAPLAAQLQREIGTNPDTPPVTPPPVKWSRPEPVRVGRNNRTVEGLFIYRSKCGRFTIRKKRYSLPVSSIGYVLTDTESGDTDYFDTLKEAKLTAEDIAAGL